jgi:cardiolipin synthase
LACFRGVDVRLLMPKRGDHFMTQQASRYYWGDILDRGVKVYLYNKGMMHSKVMMVDGKVGIIGSANLDPRSLYLNFEAGCILFDSAATAKLEAAYENDLKNAKLLERETFAHRPYLVRLQENAFRLFSPIL